MNKDVVFYHHTQRATPLLSVLGAAFFVIIAISAYTGFHPIPIIVLIVIAITGANFSSLTVKITATNVMLRFGPGVIKKRFSVADINIVLLNNSPDS